MMARRHHDRERPWCGKGRRTRCFTESRGSVLLLAVVVLSLLAALFALITNSVLLGTQAGESLHASLEMLYIAEAGLAHGRAFCRACGETSSLLAGEAAETPSGGTSDDQAPFGGWIPFAGGAYRVQAFRLNSAPQSFIEKDSGILLVADARLHGEGRRRVCLLIDEPPSCRVLAWWEPD